MISTQKIVGLVIASILVALLIPLALNDLLGFTSTNSTIQTLVSTVMPIMAVISLVILFMPKGGKEA